ASSHSRALALSAGSDKYLLMCKHNVNTCRYLLALLFAVAYIISCYSQKKVAENDFFSVTFKYS
ncbi:hypothetical protein, partial [Hespellia stercorisuis]|uniref:hypothetical protein n=1 Tax=Hespellia stercorisuis TaxID=180311 RepID=UPI001A9A52DD